MDLKGFLKTIRLNESTISMILGALVVLIVGILVVNYFRGLREGQVTEEAVQEGPKLVEEEGKLVPEALPAEHTVVAGEHLWAIAENYYGSGYNWVDIARENNLANANRILVGQKLTIPRVAVRQPAQLPATGISDQTEFGPRITGDTYTVEKGDHLWGIAVRAYADGYQWVKIASENNLLNPNLIHPGNVLRLPR